MGETENTKKAPKKSYWKGLQAEYRKSSGPTKKLLQSRQELLLRLPLLWD